MKFVEVYPLLATVTMSPSRTGSPVLFGVLVMKKVKSYAPAGR